MIEDRADHTATLLPDGKVLVAGGASGGGSGPSLASAELYDPGSGSWTPTGSMEWGRAHHTATLLPDGTVLVAGGVGNLDIGILASAELYDPGSGSWTTSGSMVEARYEQTATLLPDGTVLVAGGYRWGGDCCGAIAQASAELYDSTSGSWTDTAGMIEARADHTATLLPGGMVLVAGGNGSSGSLDTLPSAELFDPGTGSWIATGDMMTRRQHHTATVLPDGTVLVAGGFGFSALDLLASAELYEPSSGSWTATGAMTEARFEHTATSLRDGMVLVAGGFNGPRASAELYDPISRSWTATANMDRGRANHTATVLAEGTLLVAGGISGGGPPAPAELYERGRGT